MKRARAWHTATLLVTVAALVLQVVLVVNGAAVLGQAHVPPLGTRLLRLFSFFTIQSNIAVAAASWMLVRDPAADSPGFRVLRLDAVVAITVTGLVHWFLLRPLLTLTGANALVDTLLHVVVPLFAIVGWLLFGPRPRTSRSTIGLALSWPVLWLAYTLIMGALTGWYPYPFIDVGQLGYPRTLLNAGGVTALFVLLFALAGLLDRRLPARPRPTSARPSADHQRPA